MSYRRALAIAFVLAAFVWAVMTAAMTALVLAACATHAARAAQETRQDREAAGAAGLTVPGSSATSPVHARMKAPAFDPHILLLSWSAERQETVAACRHVAAVFRP